MKRSVLMIQQMLFDKNNGGGMDLNIELPLEYKPRRASCFAPQKIILAKGSNTTPDRCRFVQQICAVYPEAEVVEQFDIVHSKIKLPQDLLLDQHYAGKQTLVFGELKSAVRFSEENDNACPNYWHFSPYGFCPYNCHYCYLAGTPGVKFSPTVKIYVNLPEILRKIDRAAVKLAGPPRFTWASCRMLWLWIR